MTVGIAGDFNSRPHEEVDLVSYLVISFHIISTHDLTKRSTREVFRYANKLQHFNSRPHEEVDIDCFIISDYFYVISTHDLTKRSTTGILHCDICFFISTHDLTKRSTYKVT